MGAAAGQGQSSGELLPTGQCWHLAPPLTLGRKTPEVSWHEMGNRARLSPLGGMSWDRQFWGALNNGESLIQRDTNQLGEEATKASSSALASLCHLSPPKMTLALPALTRGSPSERIWGSNSP